MPLVIGTDEAGYGPNLGPLVITATTWETPDGMQPQELWAALDDVVAEKSKRGERRLHVADSKKVYSSGKSIRNLERGVLTCLGLLQENYSTVGSLGKALAGDSFLADYELSTGVSSLNRYSQGMSETREDLDLPVVTEIGDIRDSQEALGAAFDREGIRLLGIESSIVFAPEFNERVARHDSKGVVLSAETLRLVRSAVDAHGGESPQGWVVCDKHGGRNRYDDVISKAFDDGFIFRLHESGPSSAYRLGDLEFCFRTRAEEILPVALASMVSKYVREVVMMQFNAYWQSLVPGLKATKGYPVDAKRFWACIEPKCIDEGLEKSTIWRCR